MTDPTPPSPRAEEALQRLRKLAEGNDLPPQAIQLFSAEEKTYTLEGTIVLSPLFETAASRYLGPPRGSNRKIMANGAALKAEVERLRQSFQTRQAWIADALAQLKEQPESGWGLDDVRISLPKQSVVLAAGEACPACQGAKLLTCRQCYGHGAIVCPQCQGNRQEICHVCNGSGKNPSMPDQPCLTCNGHRYAPCRFCQGRGQLTCPTCQGKRGTTCTTCNGTGSMTEEVAITCGARTHFHIKGEGMPSGLRRGLDRLGVANLAKGHADIESLPPPQDEEEEDMPMPPSRGAAHEPKKPKPPKPEIHYRAQLPYADLRMNFAGKKVVVGVFGKKKVLLGVPAFLDTALEPARAKLQSAVKGGGELEAALETRAMKDAFKLQVAGVRQAEALRRTYPYGLSPQVAAEIFKNMRLALNRLTLRSRSLAAMSIAGLSGGVFAGVFLTDFHQRVTRAMKPAVTAAIDGALLLAALGGGWLALSAATRFVLQRRFPGFAIPLTQKTGMAGLMMLAATAAAFGAMIALAPVKPEWVGLLLKLKFR